MGNSHEHSSQLGPDVDPPPEMPKYHRYFAKDFKEEFFCDKCQAQVPSNATQVKLEVKFWCKTCNNIIVVHSSPVEKEETVTASKCCDCECTTFVPQDAVGTCRCGHLGSIHQVYVKDRIMSWVDPFVDEKYLK